jgi:WD40 repeat protein
MLSKTQREAFWQKLCQNFPRVPANLAFEIGSAVGPNMKHKTSVLCCLYSLDGASIYAAGGGRLPGCDTSIRVFDSKTRDETLTCKGHGFGIYELALDPRTGFLASASEDYSVVLWNLDQKDAIFLVGGDPIVKGNVAFAAHKSWLAIGESEAYEDCHNSVFVIDLDKGEEVFRHKLPKNKGVSALAITENGENLVAAVVEEQWRLGPEGGELFCWNIMDAKKVWESDLKNTIVMGLEWLPGEELLVAAILFQDLPLGDFSGACTIHARSGKVHKRRLLPGIGASCAIAPDAQTVVVAYGEQGIELLHAFDLAPVKAIVEAPGKGYGSGFCSVQFSRGGETVLAGNAKGELQTFSIASPGKSVKLAYTGE